MQIHKSVYFKTISISVNNDKFVSFHLSKHKHNYSRHINQIASMIFHSKLFWRIQKYVKNNLLSHLTLYLFWHFCKILYLVLSYFLSNFWQFCRQKKCDHSPSATLTLNHFFSLVNLFLFVCWHVHCFVQHLENSDRFI